MIRTPIRSCQSTSARRAVLRMQIDETSALFLDVGILIVMGLEPPLT